MKNVYLLFIALLFFSTLSIAQTDLTGTLMSGGLDREYRLHLPPGYDGSEPTPLVFNLHGYTSDAWQQEFYSGMKSVSDANGFILCHPEGIDNSWNSGFGSSADDVGFISDMIDEFASNYNIDLNRVYSTGMSNGGYMSYKLACELGDRIAAVASVTGSMVPSEFAACNPIRKTPVMQIHGTADPTVPYNGSGTLAVAIETVVAFWAENSGCVGAPTVSAVPDTDTEDGCTAEHWVYNGCEDESAVEFYKIIGGEHTWPGAPINIGITNGDINASEVIWSFFSRFSLDMTSPVQDIKERVEVQIGPNPTTSITMVQANTMIQSLSVFDISGRELISIEEINTANYSLNASGLANGVYWLEIETSTGTITKKLMKQ